MGQPELPGFERTPGRLSAAFDASPLRAAFVSTYVPRRCGIATFTRDLIAGIRASVDGDGRERLVLDVAAMHLDDMDLAYPSEVRLVLPAADRAAYLHAARTLSQSASVVSIQHEYGIYGGPDGDHLLHLLDGLRVPAVTTFHTALRQPTAGQRRVAIELARRSSRIVVMADRAREILAESYGISGDLVEVIPHGVPDLPFVDPEPLKHRFGLAGRDVILGFGLLSPTKRYELVIEALPALVHAVPETLFVIVGETHPEVRRRYGESYRALLVDRVERLGLRNHVLFVDRYVDQAELCDWLLACDIFVTPYGSAQQIVSGTLAYALAAGKAIVSTPYEYAIELLADGRGVLTPFDDVEALGDRLLRLLADVGLRDRMRRRAWEHGRSMIWREVGARHLALLEEAAARRPRRPSHRPATPVAAPIARRPAVPVLVSQSARGARNHLDRLSDGVGIAQHAVGVVPDLRHGYCTDDVARALVVDLLHAEHDDGPDIAASIRRQLTFLGEAFQPMSGRFRNLRAADGRWLDEVGSQDAHGRGVHALGEAIGRAHDVIARRLARELFDAALPATLELDDLRPWAYVALGCDAALAAEPRHSAPRRILAELGGRLADAFGEAASTDPIWPWPAPIVTYDNGAPPQALIVAGRRLGRRDWVRRGADILHWLAAAQRTPQGHLRPIGNRGWWPRGKRPAWFDQQPIEALSILEAALAAEEATGDRDFGELAEAAYGWFLGANDLGLPVADPEDGACHDGLGPDGLNANRGAESTLAWLLAVERMRGRHAATTLRGGPTGAGAAGVGTTSRTPARR